MERPLAGEDTRAPSPTSSTSSREAYSPEPTDLIPSDEARVVPRHQAGVDWSLAEHGCRTWLAARTLAQQPNNNPDHIRTLHIDAVKYMAMSLPQDMTAEETARFQRGLPLHLLSPPGSSESVEASARKNSLRRSIARMTCWFIAIIVFFIPLLMTGLNEALVYERQHQLTERVLTNTLDLGTLLSERGIELQRSFSRFRGGSVGGAVIDSSLWVAEGFGGGIMDGVRDVQISKRRPPL